MIHTDSLCKVAKKASSYTVVGNSFETAGTNIAIKHCTHVQKEFLVEWTKTLDGLAYICTNRQTTTMQPALPEAKPQVFQQLINNTEQT